jgi:hypothetical protein
MFYCTFIFTLETTVYFILYFYIKALSTLSHLMFGYLWSRFGFSRIRRMPFQS